MVEKFRQLLWLMLSTSNVANGRPGGAQTLLNDCCVHTKHQDTYSNNTVKYSNKAVSRPGYAQPTY